MTILLEVFTSKSMKLSPAGLCQRRLVNSRDAELRGNPPHPPELTHRRRGVAGRGRRGEALSPPPPRTHAFRCLMPLLGTSWRKLTRKAAAPGGEGCGVHTLAKKMPLAKASTPPHTHTHTPARAGPPQVPAAPCARPELARRSWGLIADPLAAAASSVRQMSSEKGSPPRSPSAPAPRPPGARTPPPRKLPFPNGSSKPDALAPAQEWEQ